jgi:DNA-binding response OmpR family regulator
VASAILLVEDNEKLNEASRRFLEMNKYTVLVALTLAEARTHIKNIGSNLDVILLDTSLPDGSGLNFCQEIRNQTTAHIIFLTSAQEYQTIIAGFNLGGDGYITKPYKLEEMLARVNEVMRRRAMMASEKSVGVIKIRSLTMNPIGLHATLEGKDMPLTSKEFSVLYYLAQKQGRVLSKQFLYESVWKQPIQGDDHALKNVIYRLRKKLEAENSSLNIVSVRNEGYSFEA